MHEIIYIMDDTYKSKEYSSVPDKPGKRYSRT